MQTCKTIISIFCLNLLLLCSVAWTGELSESEFRKLSPMLKFFLNKNQVQTTDRYSKHFEIGKISNQLQYKVLFKLTKNQTIGALPEVKIESMIGQIGVAQVSRTGLLELARTPAIRWIDISKIVYPCLDVSRISTEVDHVQTENPYFQGKGTLVAVFDSGIDWKHEDFINNQGKSRILFLWDVTDDAGPHPSGFDYGTEYTQAQINDEIDGSPTGLVREKDTNGHGTHVAGIAAGDGSATGNGEPARCFIGMAPLADLIIVKGGSNGYSTANQVNGTAYILQKVQQLGRPVVMNFSIGGHWGAHDGTDLHEQAIDAAVGPGKAIVVAAANNGDEAIHASGNVPQNGTLNTAFQVKEDAEEVWIVIWHEGTDLMQISVTTPDGYSIPAQKTGTLEDWKYWDTPAGRVGIIAPTKNPENQDFEINLWIDNESGTAINAGEWQFSLTGVQIRNGRFDAWTKASSAEFTTNLDYTMLLGMPGTAREAITVASYCTKRRWQAYDGTWYEYESYPNLWDISDFSSPGPTRDGRLKPEITAPGHGIAAALSQACEPNASRILADGVHQLMQGTSMAAPHVAGAVALLFEKNPQLTPTQLKSILSNSAYVDDYTGTTWNRYWGYGKLDVAAAIKLVAGSLPGTVAYHDVGQIQCGLSDWGEIGNSTGADPGFRFPVNSELDHGYSGTLVATVCAQDVADSYGTFDQCEDDLWRPTAEGHLRITSPGIYSDQDGYAQFEKRILTPTGLTRIRVNQYSYAWRFSPDNQFIILDYEITNCGPMSAHDLILGFFMDWDCQPDHATNEAGYDADLNLAYMQDTGTSGNPVLGTMLLGAKPASFDIINNANSVYPTNDLPDLVMYELMRSAGFMGGIGQGDLSILLALPKMTLHPTKTTRFSVALVAGSDLSDLRRSAARARLKFNQLANGLTELFYDDGTPEGGAYCTDPGEQFAVCFTPEKYPATLKMASFYTRDAAADIRLHVYDDNGPGGTPGTRLCSPIQVTPNADAWNLVNLGTQHIVISGGNFYIGLEWIDASGPTIGYDQEFPHAGRSWYFDRWRWTNFTTDSDPDWHIRDLMIGAGFERTAAVANSFASPIPEQFYLSPNYPNPFNPETTFFYQVPQAGSVTIQIYNILGQKVRTLVDEMVLPGTYEIKWTGENKEGNTVASGIYFTVFQTNFNLLKRKMVLIR